MEIQDSRGVNEKEMKFPGQDWLKKSCGISMACVLVFGLGNSNGYNNFAAFPEVYKASVTKANQSDKSKDLRDLF